MSGEFSTRNYSFSDVTIHNIGIKAYDAQRDREINRVVIMRNTMYPHEKSLWFETISDNQSEMRVVILKGGEHGEVLRNANILGTFDVQNLPEGEKGSVKV